MVAVFTEEVIQAIGGDAYMAVTLATYGDGGCFGHADDFGG